MRWLKMVLLVLVTWVLTEAASAPKPQIHLLVTRPVDAGMAGNLHSLWAVALVDQYVRFRLEPLSEIKVLSEDQMLKHIPEMARIGEVISNDQYEAAAEKVRASHFMIQRIEYSEREKMLYYYMEIIKRSDKSVVASTDKSIPADQINSQIDSGLVSVLNKLGINQTELVQRFFQIPVLGKNFKLNRQLGETILKEKGSDSPGDLVLGKEYEKIILKDPFMLLANYSGAQAFFRAKQYEKSSKYLKELLDLVPIHSELYYMLAQSYRLSGKFEDALNVIASCERNRIKSIPFMVEKALSYEGMGQNGPAQNVHSQILTLSPAQPLSLHFMAKQKNKSSNYKEAFTIANKLVAADSENGYGFFERGKSYIGLKQEEKALDDLKTAAKLLPDDPMIQEVIGDLYHKNGEYKDAVSHFRNALKVNQDNLELYLKTAKALEMNQNASEALKLLRSIEIRFSGSAILLKATGQLEFSTGNLDKAAADLEKYLKVYPSDGEIFKTLGNIYSLKSDFSRAVDAYKVAMPLVKEKNSCRMPVAEIYIQQKNYASARKLLNEVLSEKQEKGANKMMGEVLMQQNELKSALSHFEKERSLHGDNVEVQEKIAQLYFRQNFLFPAKTEYTKLTKLSPSHPEAYFYLAVIALKDGDQTAAGILLKKASALGPGNAVIYGHIGDAYEQAGKSEKAVEAYRKVLSFDSKNSQTLLKLVGVYQKTGEDSLTAETGMALFAIDAKKYSGYLAQAGHLFNKIGMDKKAMEAYALFLDKGNNDFNVNSSYATLAFKNKDYAKVISLLKTGSAVMLQNGNVLLVLAESYCQTGQYNEAIPLLSKLLASNQESKHIMELTATAYEKTGDTLSAITFYERYLRFPSEDGDANLMYHLGELYEKKQMTSKAIARYEENIKESPDGLRNHERLGNLYIASKQWKNARTVLEKAVEFPHANVGFKKMLARTYAALQELDLAADLYNKYLVSSAGDASAWKELGEVYYKQKLYEQAVKPLTKAVELLPEDFDCLSMLGTSLVKTEEYSKAISPLGRARAIQKSNTELLELTAICYRNLKQTSSLALFLNEWIKLDPKRYDIKIELGSLMLEEKKVPEAIKMLTEAVKFIPSEVKPRLLLAQAYEVMGNDSLRLLQIKSALKFAPGEWEPHYQAGRYYLSKGILNEAELHLAQSIKLNPGHIRSRFDYGSLLLDLGNYTDAFEQLNTALESEPNNARYLSTVAYALILSGKQKEALENIAVAIGKGMSDAQVLYWAGKVYYKAGKKEPARQVFKDALSIDPSCASCFEALGDMSMEEVKFKDAARNYFKSWEKGGFNEKRAFKLGSALSYDRKFVEAKDFYEAVVQRNSGFNEANYRLVDVYCELGELKNARALLTKFKNDGTPWMQLAQGKIFETENNTEAAMVAYRIAGRIDPQNPHYLAGLGHTYLKQKKVQEAIEALSMASAADQLNMQLLIDLGVAFQGSGDSESAFQYYHEVEKKCPEHPDIYALMASVKSQQKMHIEAAQICERGLKYNPENTDLLYTMGVELESGGKYEPAIGAFQTALKKGKGKPVEALRHIGNIYYAKMVNNKKAKEFFKRYVKAGGESQDVAEAIKKLEGI
ncbi:MAG: tetratricopeptide repeat protein [Fibrobacter sp.]|nr:tetratricopeptide repeat protein [Fibrobacter sp.]